MSIKEKLRGLGAILNFDNRWELIFHRLFFRSGLLVYRYRGMEFLVDHRGGDACGTRECIVGDTYRRHLYLLDKNKPLTVLDIGANGGGLPLLLQAEGFNLRRVICVEVNPFIYQRLLFNLEHNLSASVLCLNVAAAPTNGEISIFPTQGSPGDSMLTLRHPNNCATSAYTVATRTINELLEQSLQTDRIDLCKIDIEGTEHDILCSPGHEALSRCNYLLIELHGDERTDETMQRLSSLGFRCLASHKERDAMVALLRNQKINVC